jgi:tRNA threonylcarbamoyladenosine biosynthesis protein TsaE
MILSNAHESDQFGRSLAPLIRIGDVITLSGELGAGKTSIARGLLSTLGLEGEAPSPSYGLVIPYDPPQVRLPVLHVDLYRLDGPDHIEELGLDDALIDSALIIEWPERLGNRLWANALQISLFVLPDGTRRLTAQVPSAWKERWLR